MHGFIVILYLHCSHVTPPLQTGNQLQVGTYPANTPAEALVAAKQDISPGCRVTGLGTVSPMRGWIFVGPSPKGAKS